jgi:hypothetical protein
MLQLLRASGNCQAIVQSRTTLDITLTSQEGKCANLREEWVLTSPQMNIGKQQRNQLFVNLFNNPICGSSKHFGLG